MMHRLLTNIWFILAGAMILALVITWGWPIAN